MQEYGIKVMDSAESEALNFQILSQQPPRELPGSVRVLLGLKIKSGATQC